MTTTRHQAHSQKQSTSGKFYPDLKNLPPLPKINWETISDEPPKLLHTSHDYLPPADAVVITWAESEWAAMEHVFVQSDEEMSYSAASTFVVGTTSGEYADFACIEMDDAVIGKVCVKEGLAFGFVRNISDPAQNAALPSEVQRNWGSAVYEVFGFYTSYNGALATWAMLAGQES